MNLPHIRTTVAPSVHQRQLVPCRPARYVHRMADERRLGPRDELEPDVEQALEKTRRLPPRKREPGVLFERIRAPSGAFLISAFHKRFERDEVLGWNAQIPLYDHVILDVPSGEQGANRSRTRPAGGHAGQLTAGAR